MSRTPFSKVLVANRGEIALRVMRSARRMGIKTVAVHSAIDAGSRHVRAADEAICIGDDLPSQSYLRVDAIVAAARATGAGAVHPGYGFLAENARFAAACRSANLVFIGPSAQAIETMGDKAGAKERMKAAGVPCVPGYQGIQDEDVLEREAAVIGYPLMIKAVAGGGGRGMRLVTAASDFRAALRSARSEAANAFGNGDVLLESAVINPRHIEIQVFADRYGAAVHLGERDCSVQRRHQKIIEEAPSPAVSPRLRAEMGAAAVRAALAIGYEGAGTLEFLLDQRGSWYFMEMNTRLQVEHPVTEAITGLDLVDWQFRVAAGEPLPLTQDQVTFKGHAIEVRLCAEDPDRQFMPESGRLRLWQASDRVRIEHALESGTEVPPFYDSMIAKLIAHGETRDDTRRLLASALDETVALGISTNRSFLAACLRHSVFARGEATTGFVSTLAHELLSRQPEVDSRALAIAALLLRSTEEHARVSASLASMLPVEARLEWAGRVHEILLLPGGGSCFRATLQTSEFCLILSYVRSNSYRIVCDDIEESGPWVRHGNKLFMQFRGLTYAVDDLTRTPVSSAIAASDGRIRASINGRVIAVHAKIGDSLTAGQAVVTLEAMKMEHTHLAPVSGILRTVNVALNDQVVSARVLAEIESEAVKS